MGDTGTDDGRARGGATPRLRVHLLGDFQVSRAGVPVPADRWSRAAARDLVKLLAVSPGHVLHREQVMAVCWPAADPEAAQRSLRVTLHAARRAMEPELAARAASSYLVADGSTLRLTDAVTVDADDAERAAVDALRSSDADVLTAALTRFTGDLLPEDRYADWAATRREHLADLRDRLSLARAEALLAAGAVDEAAEAAHVVLDTAPAEERAHRVVMAAYLGRGLRRQALRQYHRCREALAVELGVRPDGATERLHRQALGGGPGTPDARPSRRAAARPAVPAAVRSDPPGRTVGRPGLVEDLLTDDGPPAVLVAGEAGLGKTRLVTQAGRQALAAGWTVLWGAGHDAEGTSPYGVVVEALDGWLADAPVDVRADAAAEHPELAAVLPSLGLADAGGLRSPEEERHRLFRAAAGLLAQLADEAPVLVVLDDVHAGDLGSLLLVAHLARWAAGHRADVRFVLTYRGDELDDADPRRTSLAGLVRAGLARVVDVERLDRAACDALVADVLGADPGPQARDRVWELSLGNPLFVVELARELGRAEAAPVGAAPTGVRQLVAARLSRLEPATRRVVEIVAVAGDGVALSEVADVATHGVHPGMTAARTAAGVDAAVTAAVLVEREVTLDGRVVAGLAFRHPLVRVTCYDMLSAARRRLLHGAYSDAVLRRRPEAVDTLAGHLSRADDPRAVDYLRRAAERAAALGANDTADRYYVELTARLDRAAVEASRARIDRSAVLQRMGRYPEAVAILREALDDLAHRDEADLVVLAAGRLAEALARARDADSALAVLDAHPLHAEAGPRAVATHRLGAALACMVVGRYVDAVEAATAGREAAELVCGDERRGLLARAASLRASGLALAGRFVEASRAADEALPHAEAYGDQHMLSSVLSVLREQARRAGRLADSLAAGRRALELAERSGNAADVSFELANLAELHLLRDDVEPAVTAADRAVAELGDDEAWSVPYVLATRARVGMRTGSPDPWVTAVRAQAAATARGDRQALDEALVAQVEQLLGRRDAATAARVLADVSAPRTAHLRAWVELVEGHPVRAAERSAAEADRAAAAGERVLEVSARGMQAAALLAAGHGDEAARVAQAARELANELGLRGVLRQIDTLLVHES